MNMHMGLKLVLMKELNVFVLLGTLKNLNMTALVIVTFLWQFYNSVIFVNMKMARVRYLHWKYEDKTHRG